MGDFVIRGNAEKILYPGKSIGEIFFKVLSDSQNQNALLLLDKATNQNYSKLEVYHKSVRAAFRLHEFGVRANDMIGIVAENRVDYIWIVLGCFYLGASVNPINPDYIAREIQHAFEISMPKFVITETEKINDVYEATSHLKIVPTIITFDDFHGEETSFDEVQHSLHIPPVSCDHHVALVLCSSGTTGLPKAVALSDEAIKNCLHHVRSKSGFSIDEQETLIAVLPFYHILGLLVVLASVLHGAKSIVMRKFKPDVFVNTIETHRVTKLFIVPPLALFLAQTKLDFDASSIKDVICGAAPLGPEAQKILERRLGVPVRQAYGMTESCAISLTPPNGGPPGSAGLLLCNLQAVVRNLDTGLPVGVHQSGELCIKSPCLMNGYLQNEVATKECFDVDGFLRTGDIGYYDEQGYLFIVDRLKELIKYKGFQVPPAELEDILVKHPDIKDAAVVGIPDNRAGELARAFVVKAEGSTLTQETVQDWVAKHVSVQKRLHGGVEFVSKIPKSAAGKILRKQLKQTVV